MSAAVGEVLSPRGVKRIDVLTVQRDWLPVPVDLARLLRPT